MNNQETNNNEVDLQALLTKVQSLETMLLLTRTELKITQVELEKYQEYINHTLVGSVSAFAMPNVPEGWLICDGKAVSRTVYPRLFQAIATIYGKGDGSTTFNLPDMRGLFVRGHDPEGKNDSKREFGSYQGDQIQSHSHTDSGHSHICDVNSSGNHKHYGETHDGGVHTHDLKKGCLPSPGNPTYKELCLLYSNPFDDRDGKYASHPISYGSNYTKASPSHSHNLDINDGGYHSHLVSINNGQANLSNPTNARHGSETRVKNLALIYCIKY